VCVCVCVCVCEHERESVPRRARTCTLVMKSCRTAAAHSKCLKETAYGVVMTVYPAFAKASIRSE